VPSRLSADVLSYAGDPGRQRKRRDSGMKRWPKTVGRNTLGDG
jgi:hypothetical protein